VPTHPGGKDWDFSYSYDWGLISGAPEDRLMAAREVSYRQWSGGVPFEGFYVELDFEFPTRGQTVSAVGLGRDGDFVADRIRSTYNPHSSRTQSGWGGAGRYMGCFNDPNGVAMRDMQTSIDDPTVFGSPVGGNGSPEQLSFFAVPFQSRADFKHSCSNMCSSAYYKYFGLQWTAQCYCGNTYGNHGVSTACGPGEGESCADGRTGASRGPDCGNANAVFTAASWTLPDGAYDTSSDSSDASCWSFLPALVPNPHIITEEANDRWSQGESYFTQRFCAGWSNFIVPSCDPAATDCDEGLATTGNAVFDGGGDMYDIGNLVTTSLMAGCDTSNDIHDCPLGSLYYRSDFERVPTNCFGANGHYQMQQFDAMWVFFTTNVHDSPIDFVIAGNLGSDDGSGTVTEYVFDAPPHTGFVKRECGDEEGDPSVNHLIIVDSTQGRPIHSCNYVSGGDCTGASSDLDDDIVSGIAPGSPILYLLYSTESGACMKEDEHRAIFDQATRCILAADPFSAVNRRQSTASQLLVEVDVDDAGHIVFGGGAPYAGWTRGSPAQVAGPSSYTNALQFSGHEFLQLGDAGVEIEGNWTLDCWVHVEEPRTMGEGEGVLVESLDGVAHMSMHRQTPRAEIGSEAVAGMWVSSGIDIAAHPVGWVRLSMTAERSIGQAAAVYSYFIDGERQSSLQLDAPTCGDSFCSVNFFAIGGRADGTAPLPLPVHRLRLFAGALESSELDASGLPAGDLARYQPENSRSVMLSRGIDALEVQWDTLGWNAEAHDHVHATLDSVGGISLRCNNVSMLWDRAVASAGLLTGSDISNWTSSALALTSDASTGLRVRYVDSDPCFDLVRALICHASCLPLPRVSR
jgi:hypothetical protein